MSHLRGKNIAKHLAEKKVVIPILEPLPRVLVSLAVPARFRRPLDGHFRLKTVPKPKNRPESEQSIIPPPPPGRTSHNAQRIGWYLLNHPRRIFLASPSAETVGECTILPDSNSRYASAAERTLTFICSYGSRFTLPLLNPLARKT